MAVVLQQMAIANCNFTNITIISVLDEGEICSIERFSHFKQGLKQVKSAFPGPGATFCTPDFLVLEQLYFLNIRHNLKRFPQS